MNKYKKWQYKLLAEEMVNILNKKGYEAYYADDLNSAREIVINMIPKSSTVALGGSETLNDMGLIDEFRNGDYNFFDRYQNLPFSDIVEIYRQSMLADFFVSSVNAITKNGELVSIDSTGNRVASMIFGPKKVIIVAGVNKVVDNLDEAYKRLKKIAPMNALRNGHNTPCVKTGECMNCEIQASVCNFIGIINNGRKFPGRINIILIADEVGF